MDGDRIQSPEHFALNKNRAMDNVQKHNSCINTPPSQILDLICKLMTLRLCLPSIKTIFDI
jgi:hypothetical protein